MESRRRVNSAVRRYLGKTMGLQTDLFVGSIDDARNYDGEATTALERDQPGGLTNLEFETLWAIVANEAWDVKRHALEEVASTEESWTFRFPDSYVTALQSLDVARINNVATTWAATEEISASSFGRHASNRIAGSVGEI